MVFQEQTYSVLLVSASKKFNSAVQALLPVSDYWPVMTCGSVAEARRRMLEQEFDIILINAPLPDDFGMGLAIDACSDSSAGVLIMVKAELYDEVYAQMVSYGVMTLSKPAPIRAVSETLRILCATRERLRRVEQRQISVEERIEEIRLVNRAKWLLIECLSMTEGEAHRYIEKQAMDRRITRREAAEDIIKTYK